MYFGFILRTDELKKNVVGYIYLTLIRFVVDNT